MGRPLSSPNAGHPIFLGKPPIPARAPMPPVPWPLLIVAAALGAMLTLLSISIYLHVSNPPGTLAPFNPGGYGSVGARDSAPHARDVRPTLSNSSWALWQSRIVMAPAPAEIASLPSPAGATLPSAKRE